MSDSDNDLQEYIARLDPESRLLLADANIGKDAEEWLNTDLGRVLTGFAQQEYADALLQLERTAWWRRRRIQELQNRAWRARSFLTWLRSLVIQGRAAIHTMSEQESNDAT